MSGYVGSSTQGESGRNPLPLIGVKLKCAFTVWYRSLTSRNSSTLQGGASLSMRILSGWKEIAAHLHQAVRTVQRWEAVGLPIHRVKTSPHGHVVAFAEELDIWLEASPMRLVDEVAELKTRVQSLKEEVRGLKAKLEVEKRNNRLRRTAKIASQNSLPTE